MWELAKSEISGVTAGTSEMDWPTSVIGGVEYGGIIQIGVTLFYRGNIYEIVKNWKWKLTNFRQELLPAPASYRILLGTNRKHKP